MKKFDSLAYLVLFAGFFVGAVAIYGLRFDGTKQFELILALAAFYLIWGLIYHHWRRDLNKWLIFEYLVIAGISVVCGVLVFVS